MELYLATAIVGLGYALSGRDKLDKVAKIPSKKKPNGSNIFNSNRVQEIRLHEQEMSNKIYNEPNIIMPGPPEKFEKADYADNTLPVEFKEIPRKDMGEFKTFDPTKREYGSTHHTGKPVSDGWYGISLTGEPIDPKSFSHNNMTPFFGSHVRQNVDEYTNRQVVENFTGQKYYDKKKTEIPHLFDPEANITNPYGMSNMSGYQRERYIVSNRRNNEAPTEKIYVGPGLNKGYTWCPSGGFQQAETRDYILPKTVDELRVKTNPKLVYKLPVVPGSKPSRPPKIGVVQKNRPDSFAVWSPDRYFITTGERIKPKQRGKILLKHSNRTTTDIRRAIGPAGPKEGFSQQSIKPDVRKSEKKQYTPGGPRGFDGAGQWTIPDECPAKLDSYVPMKKCEFDGFPKTNELTRPANRECVDTRAHPCSSVHDYGRSGIRCDTTNREETAQLPEANLTGAGKGYVPITSGLRPSRKENFVGNNRWASNYQGPQTNIVWDPKDIAKKTIKETTLSDGRIGPLHRVDHVKPRSYDPKDVPKTTNKETTHQEYTGMAYYPNESGRESNCVEAKNTNRQFTSMNSHVGNAGNTTDKPREISMMNNVTTKSMRETLSKGRYPSREGPKNSVDSRSVHATTNKFGEFLMTTKVYNSLPQADACSQTKDKKQIDNVPIRNRLDGALLEAYRKNPYTHDFESSYWTY
jgi:hypothetical protein